MEKEPTVQKSKTPLVDLMIERIAKGISDQGLLRTGSKERQEDLNIARDVLKSIKQSDPSEK